MVVEQWSHDFIVLPAGMIIQLEMSRLMIIQTPNNIIVVFCLETSWLLTHLITSGHTPLVVFINPFINCGWQHYLASHTGQLENGGTVNGMQVAKKSHNKTSPVQIWAHETALHSVWNFMLPYHKNFAFLGHTLVYTIVMEYYRKFNETCNIIHRHSRVFNTSRARWGSWFFDSRVEVTEKVGR